MATRQQSYVLNIAQSLWELSPDIGCHDACVARRESIAGAAGMMPDCMVSQGSITIDLTEGANERLRTRKCCHLERSLRASGPHRNQSARPSRRSPATAVASNSGLASAASIQQLTHPNSLSARSGSSSVRIEPRRFFRLRCETLKQAPRARSQTVIRGHRSRGASSCSVTLKRSDRTISSQDFTQDDSGVSAASVAATALSLPLETSSNADTDQVAPKLCAPAIQS